MEIITKDKYTYLVQTLSSSIKGRCDVKTYRDEKGVKRFYCTNFREDASEVIYHLLAVGFKDTKYFSQSKDGRIFCYDENNQFLGVNSELEAELKKMKSQENLRKLCAKK